jgi:hypothetical protein
LVKIRGFNKKIFYYIISYYRRAFPGLCSRNVVRNTPLTSGTSRTATRPPVEPKAKKPRLQGYMPLGFTPLDTWTHDVCVLGRCEECCTPSRERNEVLINAGLGKMKLVFPDKKAKHADVLSFLTEKFPRLKDGGGFEVLQAHGGGRWRVQSSSFCTTRERWLFPSLH